MAKVQYDEAVKVLDKVLDYYNRTKQLGLSRSEGTYFSDDGGYWEFSFISTKIEDLAKALPEKFTYVNTTIKYNLFRQVFNDKCEDYDRYVRLKNIDVDKFTSIEDKAFLRIAFTVGNAISNILYYAHK